MLEFWNNPELIRHARAQLRPARVANVVGVTAILIVLLGLGVNNAATSRQDFYKTCYNILMILQFSLLGLWVAFTCGQAVARERDLKTYDFLRTTRLTSAEIMIGKLLGEPILGYVVVAVSLPFSLLAGMAAGYSLGVVLVTPFLLVAFALFTGLFSLCLSMLVERASAAAAILVILLQLMGMGLRASPFAGLAALSIISPLQSLYADTVAGPVPHLFGVVLPYPILTLILYAAFGAWFVLMLVRNLKKDKDEIRLLSRWQAIGFAAFLNLVFFGTINVQHTSGYDALTPSDATMVALSLNIFILGLTGIFILTPHEQLKSWWRRYHAGKETFFAEQGLPWPWLFPVAAAGCAVCVFQALLRSDVQFSEWDLSHFLVTIAVFLVYIIRDTLFLQWSMLTRMKQPVSKGILYLALYYTVVAVVSWTMGLEGETPGGKAFFSALGPWMALDPQATHGVQVATWVGVGLQAGAILLLLRLITDRLNRPAYVPAISQA